MASRRENKNKNIYLASKTDLLHWTAALFSLSWVFIIFAAFKKPFSSCYNQINPLNSLNNDR